MFAWSPLPRSTAATFRDATNVKASVRLSAIADLVRWASGEERAHCIEQLMALLTRDADEEVRAAAAVALADAGAVDALPALVAAVESGPARLSQMALVAIGELAPQGHGPALEAVRRGLSSPAPALRFQALVAAPRVLEVSELTARLL